MGEAPFIAWTQNFWTYKIPITNTETQLLVTTAKKTLLQLGCHSNLHIPLATWVNIIRHCSATAVSELPLTAIAVDHSSWWCCPLMSQLAPPPKHDSTRNNILTENFTTEHSKFTCSHTSMDLNYTDNWQPDLLKNTQETTLLSATIYKFSNDRIHHPLPPVGASLITSHLQSCIDLSPSQCKGKFFMWFFRSLAWIWQALSMALCTCEALCAVWKGNSTFSTFIRMSAMNIWLLTLERLMGTWTLLKVWHIWPELHWVLPVLCGLPSAAASPDTMEQKP